MQTTTATAYSRSSCYRTYSFRLAAGYSLEIAREGHHYEVAVMLLGMAVAGYLRMLDYWVSFR
jgi:hypothetical protein